MARRNERAVPHLFYSRNSYSQTCEMEGSIFAKMKRAVGVLRSPSFSADGARNGFPLFLYMAFGTILRLFGGEGLFAIMARAAKFPCVKRLHRHLGRSGLILHLKNFCVAFRTLKLFLCHMKLVAEGHWSQRLGLLIGKILRNGDLLSPQ